LIVGNIATIRLLTFAGREKDRGDDGESKKQIALAGLRSIESKETL
jgi:hypothetical protein